MTETHDLIIVGGGPAGYTAALYAARANLRPLVIEGFNWGGQLMITSDVENYPGYVDGIMGPEMMADFRRQAERFGAEFVTDDVTKVDFSERPFRLWVENDEYSAQTVIVATGATAASFVNPRCFRSSVSIFFFTSGLSFKNCLAFSRPWPMRWLL